MFSIFGTFARTTKRVNSKIYVKIVYDIVYCFIYTFCNPSIEVENRFNIEAFKLLFILYFHEFSIS